MLSKLLFIILFGKGGEDMIAMLWAQRIMNEKRTYAQVPAGLKGQVKEILEESGVWEIFGEEE